MASEKVRHTTAAGSDDGATPSPAELIRQAEYAQKHNPAAAPLLLKQALDVRLREIDPDSEPQDTARRLTAELGHDGISSVYFGAMLDEQYRKKGYKWEIQWEVSRDATESALSILDEYDDTRRC